MNTKILRLFAFLILSLCMTNVVHADSSLGCTVTSDQDGTSSGNRIYVSDGMFRYFVEQTNYNNGEGGCNASDTADGDGTGITDWIHFQTSETNPDEGDEVDYIELRSVLGSIDFKPTNGPLLIGNFSDYSINGDSDLDYNTESWSCEEYQSSGLGYPYNSDCTVKDKGRVIIDASGFDAMTADNLEDSLPFLCDGDTDVYLRGLVIFTNGVTREDLLGGTEKTTCFKNAGDLYVCDGTPKTDDTTGDYIDPVTYDGSDTGTDGGTTNGRGITRANLSITDGISYGPDATDTDTSTQNGIPDDYWCQKPCEDETFYYDADGDSYGDASATWVGCEEDKPSGYVSNSTDCDDADTDINPGEEEVCEDGIDQDCDGRDDECVEPPEDVDGDGYTTDEGDCDDNDPSINPGAPEVCGDDIDQDCDGADFIGTTWYVDVDVDGYGSDDTTIVSCEQPEGYVSTGGDCDDSDTTISPAGTEICENGIDENCDDVDDPCTIEDDYDGDGYTESQGDCNDNDASIHPGATDICDDGIDQDCDGTGKSCSPEVCDDGEDTDGDGDTDCEDSDCDTYYLCNGLGPEEDCSNTIDDDDDGAIDCGDKDCMFDDICVDVEPEADCSDGIDNDNDVLIDCEDDDCADVAVDDDGNTCADLGLSPVGDAAYMAGGGGCSCDLTANRTASANELLPMLLGTLLLGSIVALRRNARQKEV